MQTKRYLHPTLGEIQSFEDNLELPRVGLKHKIYYDYARALLLVAAIISLWVL